MTREQLKKELILSVIPILVQNLAEGVREWLNDRRVAKQEWEKKIEDAKVGRYDAV